MVDVVTAEIDLADVRGRAQLVIVLAKLYALLVRMAAAVPQRAGRYPVFHTIKRAGGATVEIMGNFVVKCIPGFTEFLEQHRTTLDAVEAAYKAAEEESSQAHADQRCPALVRALEPLTLKRDKYRAVTGPLGYNFKPDTEQVRYGGH